MEATLAFILAMREAAQQIFVRNHHGAPRIALANAVHGFAAPSLPAGSSTSRSLGASCDGSGAGCVPAASEASGRPESCHDLYDVISV